jgi:N-acetylglucosamine-6-phosphate deacetylase
MKTIIKNAKIVLTDKIFYGNCTIENGKIVYIGSNLDAADNVIDANGKYLLAGFIDIHCHGGNNFDFMDASPEEMLEISKFHLLHGTTTLYATTMSDEMKYIEKCLQNYSELVKNNNLLTLNGVHLEGPYLSPSECGAQDTKKMSKPNVKEASDLLEKYPFIKRFSVAPELEGAHDLSSFAKDKGIVMSIAHTAADFDDVISAIDNGYTLTTHLYSGMHGVYRKNAYRTAGAVEGALYDDRMDVEIIADGKHLPDGLLKFIYKCKGDSRICLVTDAMRGSGLLDGQETVLGRREDGVQCIIEDGVAKLPDRTSFAGSVATTDRLVRTMLNIGIDLVSVSKMASKTPARVMGLDDRGIIEIGKRADLVILDENYKVDKVIFNGEMI